MKHVLDAFSKAIFIDASLQIALYELLVENGNGESQIVGFWLIRDETSETITSAVNQFCADNPATKRVQVIMGDKDFVECEAFAAVFPNAVIQICCSHTLRTFRREETVDKMNITDATEALDCLQRMTHAANDEQ